MARGSQSSITIYLSCLKNGFFKINFCNLKNLPICEIILAQIGPTDQDRVIENVKFAVLQSDGFIELGRGQPFLQATQFRGVVERHGARGLERKSYLKVY